MNTNPWWRSLPPNSVLSADLSIQPQPVLDHFNWQPCDCHSTPKSITTEFCIFNKMFFKTWPWATITCRMLQHTRAVYWNKRKSLAWGFFCFWNCPAGWSRWLDAFIISHCSILNGVILVMYSDNQKSSVPTSVMGEMCYWQLISSAGKHILYFILMFC